MFVVISEGASPTREREGQEDHHDELERWEQEQIKKGTSVPQVIPFTPTYNPSNMLCTSGNTLYPYPQPLQHAVYFR